MKRRILTVKVSIMDVEVIIFAKLEYKKIMKKTGFLIVLKTYPSFEFRTEWQRLASNISRQQQFSASWWGPQSASSVCPFLWPSFGRESGTCPTRTSTVWGCVRRQVAASQSAVSVGWVTNCLQRVLEGSFRHTHWKSYGDQHQHPINIKKLLFSLKCGTDFFLFWGKNVLIFLFSSLTVKGAPVEKTKREAAVTKKSNIILQQLCVPFCLPFVYRKKVWIYTVSNSNK